MKSDLLTEKIFVLGGHMRRKLGALIIICMCIMPTLTVAKDNAEDLRQLNLNIVQAIDLVKADDFKQAEAKFLEFRTKWFSIEDGVKLKSKDAYWELEASMGEIQLAFLKDQKDKSVILNALQKLNQQNMSFIQGDLSVFKPAAQTIKGEKMTVATLILLLEQAIDALNHNLILTASRK